MAYKQYCDASTCTGCNSMHSIKNYAASRWCYEDRFGLKRQDNFIRAKINYKDTYILTGIIEHNRHTSANAELTVSGRQTNELDYYYENNFQDSVYSVRKDNFTHLVQETCRTLGVSYNKFVKTLEKISNEMGFFSDGCE